MDACAQFSDRKAAARSRTVASCRLVCRTAACEATRLHHLTEVAQLAGALMLRCCVHALLAVLQAKPLHNLWLRQGNALQSELKASCLHAAAKVQQLCCARLLGYGALGTLQLQMCAADAQSRKASAALPAAWVMMRRSMSSQQIQGLLPVVQLLSRSLRHSQRKAIGRAVSRTASAI
jgi:hypothetical protein